MDREPERRELRAVRSDEMRYFGHLESKLGAAYLALSNAAFYAKKLGLVEMAEMLHDHSEDLVNAMYGEYDKEKWKEYGGDRDEI